MPNPEHNQRLDSWKEIAEYLGRDVRTVIRWEKEKGLPVRRVPGGKRQSVFAMTGEIDEWLLQQKEAHEFEAPDKSDQPQAPAGGAVAGSRTTALISVWIGLLAALALAVVLFHQWRAPVEPPATVMPAEITFQGSHGPLRYRRTELEVSPFAYFTAAGDFNGDGFVDIAFTTAPADVIGVLLGKGDGTFLPARLYEDCPASDRMVVADFNRDGHQDLAVTCFAGNAVAVLWGKGDGTFSERTRIALPGGPRFLAAGDLNRDGWPDLVATTFGEPALYVVRNRGGQFLPAQISQFAGAAAVAVADVNGDGIPDVIASVRTRSGFGLQLFAGKGDGTLRPGAPIAGDSPLRNLCTSIDAMDMSGDGIADLVLPVWSEGVMLLRGDGRGGFSNPTWLTVTPGIGGLNIPTLADLDGDGKRDLLALTNEEGRIELHYPTGGAAFVSGGVARIAAGAIYNPLAADLNNDGRPDILINAVFGRRLVILMGEAANTPP